MSYTGSCVIEIVDMDTDEERLVVTQADPYVLASAQAIREWRADPDGYRVRLRGNRVTFGTRGEGLGEVTYVLDEVPDEPLTFTPLGPIFETPTIGMRRVS